jgi:hypothetical protein
VGEIRYRVPFDAFLILLAAQQYLVAARVCLADGTVRKEALN